MDVVAFLKSIYLGDRGCKSLLIDGWSEEVKIQVDCISRVRADTWNYYTDEDLTDGFLVFESVKSIYIKPDGAIPNNLINDIRAEPLTGEPAKYLIVLSVDSVDAQGNRTEAEISILADSMALEAGDKPGERITR